MRQAQHDNRCFDKPYFDEPYFDKLSMTTINKLKKLLTINRILETSL